MSNYLITGITGQDGIFMTKKLLSENPNNLIYGTSRNSNYSEFYKNLSTITQFDKSRIRIFKLDLLDKNAVSNVLSDILPEHIYNFSGPSSVYDSYKDPKKSIHQITNIFNNLIESLISINHFPRLFQASSSEMFGLNGQLNLNINHKFLPNSPYATGKLSNHFEVLKLSNKYDWNIYSGIMFNHESEFRKKDYLLMKIMHAAEEISKKERDNLTIGSLDYKRDWLYAEDTIDAVHKVMLYSQSSTHIISSGKAHSIKEMIEIIFEYFNLNWEMHIDIDQKLLRTGDPLEISGDPTPLTQETGWKNKFNFEETILKILNSKFS